MAQALTRHRPQCWFHKKKRGLEESWSPLTMMSQQHSCGKKMLCRKAYIGTSWRQCHTSAQQLNWGSTSTAQRDQRHPHLRSAEPECQVARTSQKTIFEERKEYLSAGGHQTHSVEQDDDALTELNSDTLVHRFLACEKEFMHLMANGTTASSPSSRMTMRM